MNQRSKDYTIGYFILGSTAVCTMYELNHSWQNANALIVQSGITETLNRLQTYAHEILIGGAGGLAVGALGSMFIVVIGDKILGNSQLNKKNIRLRTRPSDLEKRVHLK